MQQMPSRAKDTGKSLHAGCGFPAHPTTEERRMHMAQKIQAFLVDDIDGSQADVATVRFGLDGTSYEIDLSASHAGDLRAALQPFVDRARRADGTGSRRVRSASAGERNAEIRAWAAERGYKLNERGRIPAAVVADYERAH